jgi:hypothetical protein
MNARTIIAEQLLINNEPEWAHSARVALARATTYGGIDRRAYETCAAADKGVGARELAKHVLAPLRKARLVRTQKGRLLAF